MPNAALIGPYTYRIAQDADALMRYEHKERASVYGCIRFMASEILIDPDCGPDKAAVTLLHELLHGCNDVAGTNTSDDEERIVTGLAPLLLDLLRRNPDVVRYLIGGD